MPPASLALAVGALAAYGQPGIAIAPLMLLGLIALSFWAARAPSFWAAALVGVSFGIGTLAVVTIGAGSWSWIVPVALTIIGASLYALPQALLARALAGTTYGIEVFCATAGAWTLCVTLTDYLGFPTLGEGLAAVAVLPELMGGARLAGCNLVCGIMVAGTLGCGVRLAQATGSWSIKLRYALRPLLGALALLVVMSALAHLTAPEPTGSLRAGIPQMNVPSEYFEHRVAFPELNDAFEDVFDAQLRQLGGLDLLVLSETYDGSYPLQVPKLRQRFENYARLERQAVLLSSYLVAPDGGIYNAVGAIDAQGKLVGVHRKVNLAPFGEVEFEAGSRFRSISPLPGVRLGILICQESLLRDGPRALVESGANLLVSPTSDASFGSGMLTFEHLALARLRAIETGRAMVWASAAGPSGAIDRWGKFTAAGAFREPAAATVTVQLHDDQTAYQRTAKLWPALAACALLLTFRARRLSAVVPARPFATGRLRNLTSLVLAAGICGALSVCSAAAVELRNGTAARAIRSSLELIGLSQPSLGARSLNRFRTSTEHSAEGALAYYLSFYGQRTLPTGHLPPRSLADLATRLQQEERFPTELTELHPEALPRVASIVQTKSGEYGVITSDRAGRIWLFRATSASVQRLSPSDASGLLQPRLLRPGPDPELGADSDD